jgi:hypothetical protein
MCCLEWNVVSFMHKKDSIGSRHTDKEGSACSVFIPNYNIINFQYKLTRKALHVLFSSLTITLLIFSTNLIIILATIRLMNKLDDIFRNSGLPLLVTWVGAMWMWLIKGEPRWRSHSYQRLWLQRHPQKGEAASESFLLENLTIAIMRLLMAS